MDQYAEAGMNYDLDAAKRAAIFAVQTDWPSN